MSRDTRNNQPMLKVEVPHINQLYHLEWAGNGCVWRLKEMDANKGTCTLVTPKTKRERTAKITDLRHIRHIQNNIEKKLGNYKVHLHEPIL